MDPNATLREIRELIKVWTPRSGLDPEDCHQLVQLIEALDGWISKGGFLPDAWGGRQPWHKTK